MTQAVAAVHAGADAGGAVVGMVRSLRGSLGWLHGGRVSGQCCGLWLHSWRGELADAGRIQGRGRVPAGRS